MQIKEQHRDDRGLPFVETTLQDLRYGLRALRKNPAYSAGGDRDARHRHRRRHRGLQRRRRGAAAAAALRGSRATWSGSSKRTRSKNWTRNIASPANYADWKAQNKSLHRHRGLRAVQFNGSGASEIFLTGFGEPQGLKSLGVTGNLFSVLGAPPLLGRTFTDEETFDGKARVAVLSYGLVAERRSRAIRRIVGSSITLSGRTYDVVGVMPRDFFFPGPRRPALAAGRLPAVASSSDSRRPHWLGVVARLQAGRVARAGAAGDGPDRAPARAAIPGHQHADGRPPGAASTTASRTSRARRC